MSRSGSARTRTANSTLLAHLDLRGTSARLGHQLNVTELTSRYLKSRGLRFILKTSESTSAEVVRKIIQPLGIDGTVTRLFEPLDDTADANDMSNFFLLTIPNVTSYDIEPSMFDLAYNLLSGAPVGTFTSVEPDLPHAVYFGAADTYAAINSLCRGAEEDTDLANRYWHVANMKVDAAWAIEPPIGGERFGKGIRIGHPDTGWTRHIEFAEDNSGTALAIDEEYDWDFLGEGLFSHDDSDATDPLDYHYKGLNPGHGTATGTVIVGRGRLPHRQDANQQLAGVAPEATLVPFRCVWSVIIVYDADVARSVVRAVDSDCHVISISLGGIETPALEAAVNYAVAKNVIVAAAAGNCVESVVAPAKYPNCIAVAGSNRNDTPWKRSSHGRKVDITAPGENVWVGRPASYNGHLFTSIGASQGTSFAVANVAGVTALWLAFHGRNNLLRRYQGKMYLQHVFRKLLQDTARTPRGWAELRGEFGPGIVDAEALLRAELPLPVSLALDVSPCRLTVTPYLDLIVSRFGGLGELGETATIRQFARMFKLPMSLSDEALREAVGAHLERYGPEIAHIFAERHDVYQRFTRGVEGMVNAKSASQDAAGVQATQEVDGIVEQLSAWTSAELTSVIAP